MTRSMKPLRAAGLIGLLMVVMCITSAGVQDSPDAVVVSSVGYADVKFSGKEQVIPLVEGMKLSVGDMIETDNEAKVVLGLPDKSTLIIGESSRVVIKELGMVEVTKLSTSAFDLIKGKIRAIVNPFVNKESTFMIQTNNTTVGVRGTEFGEMYDPDTDRTYVLGLADCVSLTATKAGGDAISLCAGDELTIIGGEHPGDPNAAPKETIEGFLEEMSLTGQPLGAEDLLPPYIVSVFVNRVINLQNIDGALTLTQNDLTMDRTLVISGSAADERFAVTEVEVSIDRGTTWEKAAGTTDWKYEFTPQENIEYELMVRAKNERGIFSDPWELGIWIIMFRNEDYESVARSMLDKLFSAIRTADSSAEDLISDNYDGVIDDVYTKAEVVDKITSSTEDVTAGYTLNQVTSTGDAIVATIGWSATIDGKRSEGTTKFWLAKSDGFRFTHSEGTWFLKSSRTPELTLAVVSSIYGPPCENALRILLVVPDVPPEISTVTVYPITTCESTHFAILTRAFFEDMTGETDGFGGDFHYETTTGCSASPMPPCAGTIPFLYSSINPLVSVTYSDYGYNLSASTMLP